MINCIIIDDEEHAIEVIRIFCQKFPYLDVVAEFSDPIEATAFIDSYKNKIDLVFLDIEMPGFSGIDFLKAYPSFPNVIMVTGHADFGVGSYEYGVIDYLLKPIPFDRFAAAIAKVCRRYEESESRVSERLQEGDDTVFYLKVERSKYIKMAYADIQYIQATYNSSDIYTATEKRASFKRLKEWEQSLPAGSFHRVHKSYIINMDYFECLDGNRIKLRSVEEEILLGEAYRSDFLEYLNKK